MLCALKTVRNRGFRNYGLMKMRGFFISSNQDGQVKPMIFKAMLSLIIATLFHSMFANLSGRNIVESVADTIRKYHKECYTINCRL